VRTAFARDGTILIAEYNFDIQPRGVTGVLERRQYSISYYGLQ